MKVRPMRAADADAVLRIYQAGMDRGHASFESVAPSWAAFDASKLPEHRYVAVDDHDRVLGWVGQHAMHGGWWRDVVFIERRSPYIT